MDYKHGKRKSNIYEGEFENRFFTRKDWRVNKVKDNYGSYWIDRDSLSKRRKELRKRSNSTLRTYLKRNEDILLQGWLYKKAFDLDWILW